MSEVLSEALPDIVGDIHKAIAEQWLPIQGYELLYHVSSLGRIRGLKRGRLLKIKKSSPYSHVGLCSNNRVRTHCVHALVANAFLGNKPMGYHINHRNLKKRDNRASNLEYVTPSENRRHAHLHGRGNISTGVDVILEIRRMYAIGMSTRGISKKLGIPKSTVQSATSRKTWGYL